MNSIIHVPNVTMIFQHVGNSCGVLEQSIIFNWHNAMHHAPGYDYSYIYVMVICEC